MTKKSIKKSDHYKWGENCDGWHLAASKNLSVIQERVSQNSFETRHYHRKAEQFFYILSGVATLEVEGEVHTVHPNEGFHVSSGITHSLKNEHKEDLEFLVISTPPSHGDKVEV